MSETSKSQTPAPAVTVTPANLGQLPMQKYLDRALGVLDKFGISVGSTPPQEMVSLLDQVKYVDEPRALAIGNTIQHMSRFNALVRDNVENITIGNRYLDITQMFDSVREDSKTLIAQLEDGKIGLGERAQNLWMRIRRGTPSARFQKIAETYQDVSKDTKNQFDREMAIMDAYIDFRFALKEAEVLSREMVDKHLPMLETSRKGLADAQAAVDAAEGRPETERSRLILARDEARIAYEREDRTFQLLKDITENLSVGYDVGETLVAKLKQTHDVKDRVYRRAVTFFTTNEHVFTILGTVYTSQHGLHEVTQATEAMKEGVNKGLEDVADLGRELERAALKAGYGSTISPVSVQKLVDAITGFQIDSLQVIADLRRESEANARAIRQVVEEGKKKYEQTIARFARNGGQVTQEPTRLPVP